jgi:hypothetical protein
MYSAVIDWYPNVYTGANESYTYIPIHTFSITTVVECSSKKFDGLKIRHAPPQNNA